MLKVDLSPPGGLLGPVRRFGATMLPRPESVKGGGGGREGGREGAPGLRFRPGSRHLHRPFKTLFGSSHLKPNINGFQQRSIEAPENLHLNSFFLRGDAGEIVIFMNLRSSRFRSKPFRNISLRGSLSLFILALQWAEPEINSL